MSVFSNIPTITSFKKVKSQNNKTKNKNDKLKYDENVFTKKPNMSEFVKKINSTEKIKISATNKANAKQGSWPAKTIFKKIK